jgi:hypothetical protein
METYQNTINRVIAGFLIRLFSDLEMDPEEGYLPFVVAIEEKEVDVTVHFLSGIPATPFQNDELVFEAENEYQRFYSIYRLTEGFGFVIYDQKERNEIQQIALSDETFRQWEVYSLLNSDNRIVPLKYPLGPILMHYMTMRSDAVMMHASSAFDGRKARIFTGFSGAGKSTISKLWWAAGNGIINDDRLIIRKRENGYTVYNTPMYYADIPKEAPLSAVYLIRHSPENKIKKLTGAMAIAKVMAFCIQNNFEKQFIESRLSFFSELCASVPVYELGFVPDERVVNFILENENG